MRFLTLLLLIIVLIISACAPVGAGVQPTAEPTSSSSSPEASAGLPPKAVQDAQKWLAERLGALVELVKIVDIEQARWPDACLGLAQPDEFCAQATTPGWRVIFEINGQEYEVRTDETGSTIRLADGQAAFDLMDALRAVAARIEAVGEVPQSPQPLFSVQGQRYQIDGGELQVYEYIDEAAALADAQHISPDGFTIGTAMVGWVDTPHFFQRDRYLVLYLGDSPVILSLLEGVLGPQIAGGPTASSAPPSD